MRALLSAAAPRCAVRRWGAARAPARAPTRRRARAAPRSYGDVWAHITAAAAQVGVDAATYAQLWQLQHREIDPEDYDVLQRLHAAVKPKTLERAELERFPTARVGSRGQLIAKAEACGAGGSAALPAGCSADGFASGAPCVICQEELRLGELVRVLPCAHIFHQPCIDSWLTGANTTCPVDGIELCAPTRAQAADGGTCCAEGGAQGEAQGGACDAAPGTP